MRGARPWAPRAVLQGRALNLNVLVSCLGKPFLTKARLQGGKTLDAFLPDISRAGVRKAS